MGNIKVNVKAFKKFQKDIENIDTEKVTMELIKDLSARFLRDIIKATPVDKGMLRQSWTASSNDNGGIEVVKKGNQYKVIISNKMDYASYVEYGHRQEVGRYVPALGKRLKKGWVEGIFFLEKTEVSFKDKLPQIIENKLKKVIEESLNGK